MADPALTHTPSPLPSNGSEQGHTRVSKSQIATFYDYVSIARPDDWAKNVFVIPGMLMAPFFFEIPFSGDLLLNLALTLVSVCLVASSNYVINEILDAKSDRFHPVKRMRPIAAGRISLPLAYTEWIVLGFVGVGLAFWINPGVGAASLALWIMGCVYNIPPVRSKEIPYLDVISESVNNPLRLAIGWYAMGVAVMPPVSALFAYWMLGAFLMAIKRFAEYRRIGDPKAAANYRSSFSYYNEERLLVGCFFYVALFMIGAMAFIMLYKLELVFATPVLAYVVAYYAKLGFRPDSPVQYPERLYRDRHLLVSVAALTLWCVTLLYVVDLPWFRPLFTLLTPKY